MIITDKYLEKCNAPSDIHEHLPTLKRYAEQCNHIVELGVRTVVSTWAFLAGLDVVRPGTIRRTSLISVDIASPEKHGGNLAEVVAAADEVGIEFSFIEANDLTITLPETDLLFIDTWHAYDQLKGELARHGNKASKYIILHDTETFGVHGENLDPAQPPPEGLKRAIVEFLMDNPHWRVKEQFTNNNGLTVLERKMSKEQWINEVYEMLCKSHGAPENEAEKQNLRGYAESLAGDEAGYFHDGMTPKEAHDEDLSCA